MWPNSLVTEQRPSTVTLIAEETSSNILDTGLIRVLRARVPDACFVGVAGPLVRAEGCETWYGMKKLTVVGIVEVLRHLHRLLHTRADLTR